MNSTTPPTTLATKDGYYEIVKAEPYSVSDDYLVTFRIPGLDGLWRCSCDAQGRKRAHSPIIRVKAA